MEDQAALIETLFEKTEQYTRNSVDLYKLKALDKSADVISNLSTRLLVLVFAALVFPMFNMAIALCIGESLGKLYYGFFILTGFYALAGMVLYIFRKRWIGIPLRNYIIKQVVGSE